MNELHEISSITSQHVARYIIMKQPQPDCVNLQHAGYTNVTHVPSHDIEATPFIPISAKIS
jgi:hypothetical protein